MKRSAFLALLSSGVLAAAAAKAAAGMVAEFSARDVGFSFLRVPLPADNDAATSARFALVDGAADRNSGGLEVLHDGRVPTGDDQPGQNFFFQAGTDGGRILIDLGRAVSVRQVDSYSWHAGARAPQVYALYGADGAAAGFKAEPKRGLDPAACGWTFLAHVDTRSKEGDGAGQHGVAVAAEKGALGSFRYLLFDVSKTEGHDPFGNTFFGEIDVVDTDGPALTSGVKPVKRMERTFDAENGKYRFVIDVTDAPDLAEWVEQVLKPGVQAWYPRLVALLPSEGYRAPNSLALRFREDMGGTPASAGGGGINLNAVWFRRELKREALGSVVHEMVHVVQNYGQAQRTNPKPSATPGWLVEGIADYVRWFLYEPQSHGAEITKGNLAGAKFDGSYRVSANFLDWATRTYDRDLVRKLNAVAREGRYSEALWKECTGKSVQELGDEWKRFHEQRLNAESRRQKGS